MKEEVGGTEARFALQYGDLEDFLVRLLGGPRQAINSRFRKLRPKFMQDSIRTRRGVRVSYDLPRVISIAAIYLTNSMGVPQAAAVDIVIANFPEIARGCIRAWRGGSRQAETTAAPTVVYLRVNALDPIWESSPAGASWASFDPHISLPTPPIAIDCSALIDRLAIVDEGPSGGDDPLEAAFAELDRTFGWHAMPIDSPVVEATRLNSQFFSTGPYFERARTLITASPEETITPWRRALLQSHLDYVEAPPPIDAWKQYIGTSENAPRLHHLLAAWGLELGVKPKTLASDTLRATSFPSDRRALDLVTRGERKLASLIKVDEGREG